MSAFHRFSAFVPRSVGLGLACGAFVGVALVATTVTTTMKPRFMVNANRRRPLASLVSDWLNISSSSKALDNVRHPYNLLSKLFHRPTKTLAVQVVADVPPLSYPPQDALLFRGTNFPTPESLSVDTLSRNIDDLSPFSSSDLTVDTTQLDEQQLVNHTQRSTQHLVWTGNHISELSLQWGSVSDFPFQSLLSLSLTCELALDDCIQILFQCESLTSFSIRSLAETESLMKHDFYAKEVPNLKSLTIKSNVLLGILFATLNTAQLDSIDLELGPDASPREGVLTLAVQWHKLRNVRLVGIRDTDCAPVKQQCRSATKLLHLETL